MIQRSELKAEKDRRWLQQFPVTLSPLPQKPAPGKRASKHDARTTYEERKLRGARFRGQI